MARTTYYILWIIQWPASEQRGQYPFWTVEMHVVGHMGKGFVLPEWLNNHFLIYMDYLDPFFLFLWLAHLRVMKMTSLLVLSSVLMLALFMWLLSPLPSHSCLCGPHLQQYLFSMEVRSLFTFVALDLSPHWLPLSTKDRSLSMILWPL